MKTMKRYLIPAVLTLAPSIVLAAELKLTGEQLANASLSTTIVSTHEVRGRLSLTGVLAADRRKSHRVAPVVEGLVIELNVVEHELVSRGQVLARLRSNVLGQAQADYLDALARFEFAQTERVRTEDLWKEGVVAESRWLRVDSEHKSARATLEAQRRLLSLVGYSEGKVEALASHPTRLAEFELTSPTDGIVMAVAMESGELLTAGQAAFHVDDLSSVWALVRIPVSDLTKVEIGTLAEVRVRANAEHAYNGRLESLGGEVDVASQTLEGRIVVDNPDRLLRPGMYAQIDLAGASASGLMVPASAVFQMGDGSYVFMVNGPGRFQPVAVEAGALTDGWIPVAGELAAGTEVVSEGVAELKSHWQYQGGE